MSLSSKMANLFPELAAIENYSVEAEEAAIKVEDQLASDELIGRMASYSDSVSIIAKSTVVDGDITSNSPIKIKGRVNGNISTSEDVGISGLIVGDVEGKNISMDHAGLKGNATSDEDVLIRNESVMIGDVDARNLSLDGKLKGKVVCRGKADFKSHSILVGSAEAGFVSMEDGAVLNANITTSSSSADAESDEDFDLEV